MTVITNSAAPNVSFFTPEQATPSGSAVVPQTSGKDIPSLFQPLTIRGVTFHNRIFLSPLCQYSAKDGKAMPWHTAHLGGIISRGPGLAMIEATAVQPQGRITPWDLGIWSDEHIKPLADIVEFAHSQNQKIAIQLAHAGRKASCLPPWAPAIKAVKEAEGWLDDVWGPSAVPYDQAHPQPQALTEEGIKKLIEDWVSAAKRAVEAGFDVIEIHSAHGYLLHSFLSPVSNKRTDKYGGSFENRTRLLLEIADAIRAVIPETMPLFVRVSGTDWLEESCPDVPSWRSEDTARLAAILPDHGVDFLDVSSGGNDPRQKVKTGAGYQVPFATAAKKAAGPRLIVSAVGGLYDGNFAQGILDKGLADVVFVGRMFQRNPGQVWAMADDLGVDIALAKQIGWGFKGRIVKGWGWGNAGKTNYNVE